MAEENQEEKVVFPHHEQQKLCTTRLPYRQGRKLTAVKAYTVNNESNHLLIFGVPSLKLRQEAKAMFSKFGKLLQFAITTKHPAEPFTETYHAIFESIQSARIAKKMLDTKNFYGGSLHVCYAPELEQISETRAKIHQRQKDVLNRLKNLQKEKETTKNTDDESKTTTRTDIVVKEQNKKLNMGEFNVIGVGKQIRDVVYKNKRKLQPEQVVIQKQFKPCFVATYKESNISGRNSDNNGRNTDDDIKELTKNSNQNKEIEIIDFTSTEANTITNINECLNYNNFGNEIIKKVPQKPVNKIRFNVGNKK